MNALDLLFLIALIALPGVALVAVATAHRKRKLGWLAVIFVPATVSLWLAIAYAGDHISTTGIGGSMDCWPDCAVYQRFVLLAILGIPLALGSFLIGSIASVSIALWEKRKSKSNETPFRDQT